MRCDSCDSIRGKIRLDAPGVIPNQLNAGNYNVQVDSPGAGKFTSQDRAELFWRLLQYIDVLLQLKREPPRFEQMINPQQTFARVERLRQKVLGPERQRLLFRLRCNIGGQYHDGQVGIVRDSGTQLCQEGKPVQLRHHQVEQNQIGFIYREEFEYFPWISSLCEVGITAGLQYPLQQQDIGGLIVYDQDSAFLQYLFSGQWKPRILVSRDVSVSSS
jgi:hypothetical protein